MKIARKGSDKVWKTKNHYQVNIFPNGTGVLDVLNFIPKVNRTNVKVNFTNSISFQLFFSALFTTIKFTTIRKAGTESRKVWMAFFSPQTLKVCYGCKINEQCNLEIFRCSSIELEVRTRCGNFYVLISPLTCNLDISNKNFHI